VRAFDLVGAIHAASTPGIVAAASIDEAGMVCFRLVRLLAPKR
jgi:hypothetical protein